MLFHGPILILTRILTQFAIFRFVILFWNDCYYCWYYFWKLNQGFLLWRRSIIWESCIILSFVLSSFCDLVDCSSCVESSSIYISSSLSHSQFLLVLSNLGLLSYSSSVHRWYSFSSSVCLCGRYPSRIFLDRSPQSSSFFVGRSSVVVGLLNDERVCLAWSARIGNAYCILYDRVGRVYDSIMYVIIRSSDVAFSYWDTSIFHVSKFIDVDSSNDLMIPL